MFSLSVSVEHPFQRTHSMCEPLPQKPWKPTEMCMCAQACPTLCNHMEPARLLCPWNFPGKILEWVAISGDLPHPRTEPTSLASHALAYSLSPYHLESHWNVGEYNYSWPIKQSRKACPHLMVLFQLCSLRYSSKDTTLVFLPRPFCHLVAYPQIYLLKYVWGCFLHQDFGFLWCNTTPPPTHTQFPILVHKKAAGPRFSTGGRLTGMLEQREMSLLCGFRSWCWTHKTCLYFCSTT